MKSFTEYITESIIKEGKEKEISFCGQTIKERSYCKSSAFPKKKDVQNALKEASSELGLEKMKYVVINYDYEGGTQDDRRIAIFCQKNDEDNLEKLLDKAAENWDNNPGPSRTNLYSDRDGMIESHSGLYKIILFCKQ